MRNSDLGCENGYILCGEELTFSADTSSSCSERQCSERKVKLCRTVEKCLEKILGHDAEKIMSSIAFKRVFLCKNGEQLILLQQLRESYGRIHTQELLKI